MLLRLFYKCCKSTVSKSNASNAYDDAKHGAHQSNIEWKRRLRINLVLKHSAVALHNVFDNAKVTCQPLVAYKVVVDRRFYFFADIVVRSNVHKGYFLFFPSAVQIVSKAVNGSSIKVSLVFQLFVACITKFVGRNVISGRTISPFI